MSERQPKQLQTRRSGYERQPHRVRAGILLPSGKPSSHIRSWEAVRFPVGSGNRRCSECLGRGMVAMNRSRIAERGIWMNCVVLEVGKSCPVCDGRGIE